MSTPAVAPSEHSPAAKETGQLTPDQQKRIMAAARAETLPGLLITGGLALTWGFIAWSAASRYTNSLGLGEALFLFGLFAVAAVAFVLFAFRRYTLLQEAKAGRLERGQGHVVWEAGAYRAHVPGRTLKLLGFDLAAGTYTFSYLPRSGRVVGADLVALDSPAQSQDELRHALAMANHFNLDDLPAYRQGQLGKATLPHLRRVWSTPGWWLFAGFLALFAFVYLVSASDHKDLAPFFFIVAAFALIGGLFGAVGAISPTLDVLGGKVAKVEGPVAKVERVVSTGRGSMIVYSYYFGDQFWRVSPEAYRAMIGHFNYRAYYLPRSKKLLAVEPVGRTKEE